jgi:hypothetical protein
MITARPSGSIDKMITEVAAGKAEPVLVRASRVRSL